ncbi:MAG: hypothetical protein IJ958_01780 [Agathobacter sp.]|nr:hypothetical protein [Agathobacter sp.]
MKKKILKIVGCIIGVYALLFLLTFLSPVADSVKTTGTSDFEGITAEISYAKQESFNVTITNNSEHDLEFGPYGELYKNRCGIWVKEQYGNPFEFTYLAYAIGLETGVSRDGFMIPYGENSELEKGKYKVVYEARKNTWGETDISKFDIEIEFEVE